MFLNSTWAQTLAKVELIQSADFSELSSASARDVLKEIGVKPVSVQDYPGLKGVPEKLQKLLQKLVLEKDGAEPIHFIFSDDFNINAHYIRFKDSPARVVVLNTGLLDFVESDDELAFVLGHELEHGSSEIESMLVQKQARRKAQAETDLLGEWLNDRFVQKTIENEVDVKSTLNRVHEKGMNANESRKFLIRLRERLGDKTSKTHTMFGTRINTIDAATTNQSRGKGDYLGVPTSHEIVNSETLDALHSEQAKAIQLKKIQKIMNSETPEVDHAFKLILDPNLVEGPSLKFGEADFKLRFADVNQKLYESRRVEITKNLSSAFSPEERIEILSKLQKQLNGRVQAARKKYLTPEVLENLNSVQIKAWWELENPRGFGLVSSDSTLPHHTILRKMNEIRSTESQLKDLAQQGTELSRSQTVILDQKLSRLKKEVQVLRQSYQPGAETDRILERAAKVSRIKDFPKQYHYTQNYPDDEFELYRRLKWEGETFEEVNRVKAAYATKNARRIGAGFLDPAFLKSEEQSAFTQYWLATGPLVDKHRLQAEIATGYIDQFKTLFSKASAEEQVRLSRDASHLLGRGFPFMAGELKTELMGAQNRPLNRSLATFINELTEHAKSYEVVKSGFLGAGDKLSGGASDLYTLGSQATQHLQGGQEQLTWGLETANRFLLNPSGEKYFAKRFQLFAEHLKTSDSVETLLKDLDGDLDRYRRFLSIADPKKLWKPNSEVNQALHRLIDQAALRMAELNGVASKSTTQLFKEALLTRYRDNVIHHPSMGIDENFRSGEFVSRLRAEVEKNPKLAESFKKTLRFDGLVKGASPAEKKLVYQFTADYPDFFGHSTTNIEGEPLKNYYHNRREFMEWSLGQDPKARRSVYDRIMERKTSRFSDSVNEEQKVREALRAEYKDLVVKLEVDRFKTSRNPSRYAELFDRLGTARVSGKRAGPLLAQSKLSFSERISLAEAYRAQMDQVGSDGHLPRLDGGVKQTDLELTARKSNVEALMSDLKVAPSTPIQLPLRERSKILESSFRIGESSDARDALFYDVWKSAKAGHQTGIDFLDESLVQKLYYDGSKQELARWQLEQKFGLKQLGQKAKAENFPLDHVREKIDEIKASIEKQYPAISLQRDGMVDFVESKLVATKAENSIFNAIRVNPENWTSSAELAYLDVPTMISQNLKNNFDRFETIEYLTGQRSELPSLLTRNSRVIGEELGEETLKKLQKAYPELRRRFAQANVYSRNFMMMPLLDEKVGTLAEAPIREKLTQLVLGTKADHEIYRAIFEAYVKSVPTSEQKIIFGQILSSLVENKAGGGASIRNILEAMGPMGIKAGQFIRTSGLATPEIAGELDGFLDRAMEPTRKKIISDIEASFGKDLKRIVSIGEIKGSGSINYAVRVILTDPKTKKPTEALISVQRDAVEGKVFNENEIWEKAIQDLKKHPNPKVRNVAELVEEARLNAYSTLQKGGLELDHDIQRTNFPEAQKIYGRSAEFTRSGYDIDAVKPLEQFQKAIPPELQASYSVYEYIPTVSWDSADPALRSKLAYDVVSAELDALKAGTFDRDGHKGNWLIHEKEPRLVRIDYPQLETFPKADMDAFMNTLKINANPWLTTLDAKPLTASLEKVFEISHGPAKIKPAWIQKIILSDGFPSTPNPQERLFYIRRELEELMRREGYPEVALRLTHSARSGMMSFSKVMLYEEYMPKSQFKSLLAEKIGYDWSEIIASQWKRPVAPVARAIENCDALKALRTIFH